MINASQPMTIITVFLAPIGPITDLAVLKKVRDSRKQGARGIIFGRAGLKPCPLAAGDRLRAILRDQFK
jgi:hypothetical protein